MGDVKLPGESTFNSSTKFDDDSLYGVLFFFCDRDVYNSFYR